MQLCCVGGEAAKSTNSGNVTRWESQCYVCMYTCLTGFQLQDKPKTTCLSVTQVKMKSTLGIFITSWTLYIIYLTKAFINGEEESNVFTCGRTHTSAVPADPDKNQNIKT